jgi:hypothetical protein
MISMRKVRDVAGRALLFAVGGALFFSFLDVAGVHGPAPFNPKPIEQVYWRFPIYVAVCWLLFVIVFAKSSKSGDSD